jgi:hypothetical protein
VTITADPKSQERPTVCANCGAAIMPADVRGAYTHVITLSVVCFAGTPGERA